MADQAVRVLHGYFRSSAAFRVRIALNLKGIDYQSVSYHLRRGEQRDPAFLDLNPQGLVPLLVDDEILLTQSLAILEYLDELHPNPPLLPHRPGDRAHVRALSALVACDIHPINNLRVLTYLRNDLGQPEDIVRRWYAHWVTEGFAALEALLTRDHRTGLFCHGNQPSMADICLIPQVFNARAFDVDLTGFPIINRITKAAMALSPFLAASPAEQPDAE